LLPPRRAGNAPDAPFFGYTSGQMMLLEDVMRWIAAAFVLCLIMGMTAPGVAQKIDDTGAIMLVASPALTDPDYRRTVLIAVPVEGNRHVGIIINRPTRRSLSSLFPEHEPSKQVRDPVFLGGPMLRRAIFAMVRTDNNPGGGSIRVMRHLFLATQGNVVDEIIEKTPNDARYFVGYVAWRPGELRMEVDRGMWHVLDADEDTVFRRDTDTLWEELLRRARAVTASARRPAAAPLG
jgi:putative transcriptional regulator